MKIDDPLITRVDLGKLLEKNKGVLIIKFGAKWCGPCKTIEGLVNQYFDIMPDNVSTLEVDIDDAVDIYGFLRSKKVVNGIPVMLAYYEGNTHYIPDDIVVGIDPNKIKQFFQRCVIQSKN